MLLLLSLLACNKDTDGDGIVDDLDCAPEDAEVFPGNAEICDGADNDCDGVVDDGVRALVYVDQDGDGYGGDTTAETCPIDEWELEEGLSWQSGDCDDADPELSPGTPELCNGQDDNCNGAVDEEASEAPLWFADFDGDGYGSFDLILQACEAPEGHVSQDGDCDDADPAVNPDAEELCDGVDNNCEGQVDEGSAIDAPLWYEDLDEDGYGVTDSTRNWCYQEPGWAAVDGDCDDTKSVVNPTAPELCDTLDNDCDGAVDFDGWVPADFADLDEVMDSAPPGAHICLSAGTHAASGYEVFDALILEGEGSDTTLIDADGSFGFITIEADFGLMGVTLANTSGSWGVAVRTAGGSLRLRDVLIQDPTCSDPYDCYGVVYAYDAEVSIQDLVIDGFTEELLGSNPDVYYGLDVESSTAEVDGFEYRNGVLTTGTALGPLYAYDSELRLAQVSFHDNELDVYRSDALGYLEECGEFSMEGWSIVDNSISVSRGAYGIGPWVLESGEGSVTNLEVRNNTLVCSASSLDFYGVGVIIEENDPVTMENLLVVDNLVQAQELELYGALGYIEGEVTLANSDWANNSFEADSIGLYGLFFALEGSFSLVNSSVVGNTLDASSVSTQGSAFWLEDCELSLAYNNVTDLVSGHEGWDESGDGDFAISFAYSSDPLYVGGGDYTLSSSSPLIDAGSPSIEDADGSASDVGAYGGPGGRGW